MELAEQLLRGRVPIIEGNFSCEILDPLKFIDIESLKCHKAGSCNTSSRDCTIATAIESCHVS